MRGSLRGGGADLKSVQRGTGSGGAAAAPAENAEENITESTTESTTENTAQPPAAGTQAGQSEAETPAQADWYIRTDAQMYCNASYNAADGGAAEKPDSQQTVYITAGGGSSAYVGVYKASDTKYETPVAGYLLTEAEGYRYALPANKLDAGEYVAALFPAEGASAPCAEAAFTVTEGAVFTNKTQYMQDEEIVFSFWADTTAPSGSDYRWLGLYKKQSGETYGGDYLKWVKLCGNQLISGQGYILQEGKVGSVGWSATYPVRAANAEAIWEAGEYELVLFGDDGYGSVLAKAEFTVTAGRTEKAHAPSAVWMGVYGAERGVLSGEVICSFAPEQYNASEIVAYWADENGVLAGWLPFGQQRVTGNPQRYFAFENILIPEGATNLRFYGKNTRGLSSSYYRVDLPEGAATVTGDVISEFTYLSDIHVGYTGYQLVEGQVQGTEVVRNSRNFAKALEDVKTVSGENSDGVFIVGDVTESGREEEWELVDGLVQSAGMENSVYYMLGNHDYYACYDRSDWQVHVDLADAVKPFTDWVKGKAAAAQGGSFTADESGLWYEAVAGGVHHLVLNSEGADGDWVSAHLSLTQLSWLDSRLADLAEEGLPAFVYLHQPLTDTTAGTMPGEGWDHVKIFGEGLSLTHDISYLTDILDKYPNAFFVSGHNHRELDAYRAVFPASTAQHNNFIQTGGTAYIDKEITPGANLRHEGWYVRVYADKVVFLGREFSTGQWLSGACLVFEL